jgi:hypothetical protein
VKTVKALVLAALVAGALSIPGSAAALPTQSVYDVSSPDGPDLSDADELGILLFDLDADTGRSCRYYLEWSDNVDTEALSVDCYVDEAKTHGASSCVANSQVAVPTILTNDRRFACTGFNTDGVVTPVFMLVAGESAGTGRLDGVIQFTAANTVLYSLSAELYP